MGLWVCGFVCLKDVQAKVVKPGAIWMSRILLHAATLLTYTIGQDLTTLSKNKILGSNIWDALEFCNKDAHGCNHASDYELWASLL